MTSIYTNLTIILPAAAQALAQGLCQAAAILIDGKVITS